MQAYSDVYLNDVVESQGKLFDFVAQSFPDKDTKDFIQTYMASKTRKSVDEGKAYVATPKAINSRKGMRFRGFYLIGLASFTHIINGITMCPVQS